MDLNLKGRIAIVTGGSKGIGKEIVKVLVMEGVKVITCARDNKSLEILKQEIHCNKGELDTIYCDVTNPKDVDYVINRAKSKFGVIDILVNNAGGAIKYGGFMDITEQDWTNSFKLNLMSIVYFIKASLKMLEKSSDARIINIASISGIRPGFFNPHYTTMKAAVINLTYHLAKTFASKKILVNAISAGPIHTSSWNENIYSFSKKMNISIEKAKKLFENEEMKKIPLGRIGEGQDVANMVAYLASNAASWITGACINIDGGKLL